MLLEEGSDGVNNFTFDNESVRQVMLTIERMSLYDVTLAYAANEGGLWQQHVKQASPENPRTACGVGVTNNSELSADLYS